MKDTEETVPCRICGEPTPMTGTRLCNNCWEIETRLESSSLKPEARAHFLRMLATPELFKAIDEADTAFAVVNICDDLTPQARSCLKKAWPLVQNARLLLKPNRIYAEAVKEARAAEAKEVPAVPYLTEEDWVEIYEALAYKLTSPAVDGDRKWIAHIKAIMETIGPDGENMTQEEEAAPNTVCVVVEMYGGTMENIIHDRKDLEVVIIHTEYRKYSDNRENETWIDEDRFVYSDKCSSAEPEAVEAVFKKVAEAEEKEEQDV